MSDRTDATQAQRESKTAVFEAIKSLADEAENFSGETRAAMVRDAAYAWRALTGGVNPTRGA